MRKVPNVNKHIFKSPNLPWQTIPELTLVDTQTDNQIASNWGSTHIAGQAHGQSATDDFATERTDVARIEPNTLNQLHEKWESLLTVDIYNKAKFYFYIPTANSHVDGLRVYVGGQTIYSNSSIKGVWTLIDIPFIADNTVLTIGFLSGGSPTFAPSAGNYVFIDDVEIYKDV